MIRLIAGVILIGVGIYFGLEADSALDYGWLEFGTAFTPNLQIPSWVPTNPAVDISSGLGADTFSEMEHYLSVFRVVAIVAVILGVMLAASKIFKRA